MADTQDPTRWSHTSGEAEALRDGVVISEAAVRIPDKTTEDILVRSGSSAQGDREERRQRREKERIDQLRVEKEKLDAEAREASERDKKIIAKMKQDLKEMERQVQKKNHED